MIEEKYAGRISLGVDVGTSTCQAYVYIGDTKRMLWVESASSQQEYFPSAILEKPGGDRLYGFEALIGAQQLKDATLHQTFKAFMKADPPLERKYEIPQAAELFKDMASHFLGRLMPELHRMARSWQGRTRLDVSFTLPGGWVQDPQLTHIYHQVIFDLERAFRSTLATAGIDVHAYLVEEPVAALLGIESMFLEVPEGVPSLVIDAGGGTLDAAACVATRDPEQGLYHYAIPFSRSIGVAGESLFEEFVLTLNRSGAFSSSGAGPNKLPRRWRRTPRLLSELKRVFREYSVVPVEQFSREIGADDPAVPRLTISFRPDEIEQKLWEGRRMKQIRRFLAGLLSEYVAVTGAEQEAWGAVYLVGGLGRYPLFKKLVMEVLPACESVPNPQEIIAMGAVAHARKAGLQIRQRACPYHLGLQVQDLAAGALVWDILIKAGELISTTSSRTFINESHVRHSGSSFKATFAWTNSEAMGDEVMIIAEHIVSFRDLLTGEIHLQAGDALQTRVRFDDKLRLEIEIHHLRTGLSWSTAGLEWCGAAVPGSGRCRISAMQAQDAVRDGPRSR